MNEASAVPTKQSEAPRIETKAAMGLWVIIAVVSLLLVDALSPRQVSEPAKAIEPAAPAEPAAATPAPMATQSAPTPPQRAEDSPPGYWLHVPQGNAGGVWRYIPYGSEIAL